MFLEFRAEFVDLSRSVRCVVSQFGELLRVRTVLWARQRGRGRIAGRDKRHVIGREEVHEMEQQRVRGNSMTRSPRLAHPRQTRPLTRLASPSRQPPRATSPTSAAISCSPSTKTHPAAE